MSSYRQHFRSFTGYDSRFPDPFNDMATRAMPDSLRNALEWCLVPRTLVEDADCQLIPIEQVTEGLKVLTKGGTIEQVVRTSCRKYSGDLVQLVYSGFGTTNPFEMTPEHKVYRIKNPGVKPSRIKFSRELALQADRVPASDLEVGDYVATPVFVPETRIDPRFSGYLFGLYVAEGCAVESSAGPYGVRLSLSEDDESLGIIQKVEGISKAQCGILPNYCTPTDRPEMRLTTISDIELWDWCSKHGGRYSTEKRLSREVFTWTEKEIIGFFAGWIDGDGWTHRDCEYAVCTSSRALAWQAVRLANSIGWCPTVVSRPPRNEEGDLVETKSWSYQLTFGREVSQQIASQALKSIEHRPMKQARPKTHFVQDGYCFRKIVGVDRVDYEGPVYNCEVENDHSFIADGVLTSNCEYVFHTHGTYRQAMERVISYFMTDLEFGEASDDEKEKWEDFLKTKLNIFTKLQCSLRNRECYGNDFTSLIVNFKRYLSCPKCGYWAPLKQVYTAPQFRFQWDSSNFDFVAKCPTGSCGYHGPWRVDDKPDQDTDSISIRQWSPKEIETVHCYYSDQASYFWRIPENYRQDVIRGNLYHLERVTKPVMQAIKNRQMFRFHDDAIFHMKEPTVSGIENRGWGLPRVLTNFRQIWYVQVLHRYNEAIALDYVIPFRLITPAPRGSGGGGALGITQDPLATFNMGDARRHIDQMVRRRNRNPDDWYSLPFAVQYQVLGGDASQLAPTDLMDQGHEKLLNDVGIPVDMYKGNLQLQAAPVALRLFEATWHHLVHDAIMWLKWVTAQSAAILNWEEPDVSLRRLTIVDDLEKQNVALQLMLADKISGTTAFRGIGMDWKEEQRLLGEEARTQAEIQAKVQEEMEQSGFAQEMAKGMAPGQPPAGGDPAAQGGAPPAGGDPTMQGGGAGGMMQGPVSNYLAQLGPNTPVQPQDLMQAAETIAQELLGMSESVKDSELRKLKTANPTLHSLVRTKMDEMRNQMKNQGGAMLQQQMQGAPA